jgi:hypothetical protein
LVRGTRRFAVDPRRRFGRSEGARRLLSADGEAPVKPHGAWGGLVSALQRHTVHGELAQLSKEDRQLLSLAYLSGHTNREIAAMLQVSVSTVRRRLAVALARLEDSMRRAGVWVWALALGALAVYSRFAHSRDARWPSTVAMVAAGTATAVTIGVVAVTPSAAPMTGSSGQASVTQPGTLFPSFGRPLRLVSTTTVPEVVVLAPGPAEHGVRHPSAQTSMGCHGTPTDAPPVTPVGPRGSHPGAPVTHPGKGGCGPHAS